jgi:5'-nucleotidase
MLILLSNDDGVAAPGLEALRREIARIADVVVVAPESNQSAASHSLTLQRPLRVRSVKSDIYAIDGTPTDAVTWAFHKLLVGKRPDLVISGINAGVNMGDDVTYSGTVAAAIEGTILGVPSIAASLVDDNGNNDYRPSARFIARLARWLLKDGIPQYTLLNVNLPNHGKEPLKEYAITRLGKRTYEDIIYEKVDPRGKEYFWIAGEPTADLTLADTDLRAVADGLVSITPLKIDMTDYGLLEQLRSAKIKI